MMAGMIEYRFDCDNLFGYDEDDRVGTDLEASKAKYISLIKARLAEDYPGAQLDIGEILEEQMPTFKTWGFDDEDVCFSIADAISEVYEAMRWAVDSVPPTLPTNDDAQAEDATRLSESEWQEVWGNG